MIFELLVSSERIRAYISDRSGACAVRVVVANTMAVSANPFVFATIPPRKLQNYSFVRKNAGQYTPRPLDRQRIENKL